jgi:hypothetical protein
VASAHVGVVGSLAVDLDPVVEDDHRTRGLAVLVVHVPDHASPGQGVEDPGVAFHADHPGVGQGFGDDEMLGGDAAGGQRVQDGPLHHPFGSGAALAPASSGQGQEHEPVATGRHLGRARLPPPGAPDDLLQDFGLLDSEPGFAFGLGSPGEALLQAHVLEFHNVRIVQQVPYSTLGSQLQTRWAGWYSGSNVAARDYGTG